MAEKIKIRTAYNDDYVDPGLQQITPDGEVEQSLTIQSEIDNCDINVIVDRYAKTGILPVMQQPAMFEDVSNPIDYQNALNVVISAQKAFTDLPAAIRKQFDNDPAQFLAFVDDPKNGDELIKMGLREAPLVEITVDKEKEKEGV
nr:MAG: internal scaffolding protein [Microvirus sp.]